jgi:hypothetical protein
MRTVVFSSRSSKKIDLLIQVAREIGIKIEPNLELTDEYMALPGPKVPKKLLDEWLAKDDGEIEYSSSQMKNLVRKNIRKSKSVRNGHRI